jgi:class 3 adenylate cyclase
VIQSELFEISSLYALHYLATIKRRLQRFPKYEGISYGIDTGNLIQASINNSIEYIGRPINVASRLQSSVKSISDDPGGKALLSAPFFARYAKYLRNSTKEVQIPLRNIADENEIRAYLYSQIQA